jgi:hypothetical protein
MSSAKLSKLEAKYDGLLKATSRLFERTARRHKSNKDLERTVLYLRSLYNQVAPPPQRPCEDDTQYEVDEELAQKTCYMVEVDKETRVKKRLEKEKAKSELKLALWAKWQSQRVHLETMYEPK